MSFEIWLAFVAASAVVVIIPGPTVLLVVSYALGQGWRAALPMAIGVALGDFTAMTLSLLGIGALLMASATVFTLVKWAGAAYLVYLGIKLFRAGGTLEAEPRSASAPGLKMLAHAWLVTSLNPKGILFFVAFFPHFVNPSARAILTPPSIRRWRRRSWRSGAWARPSASCRTAPCRSPSTRPPPPWPRATPSRAASPRRGRSSKPCRTPRTVRRPAWKRCG
jgi:threonine/homoserine/homoserine lactone efflux protein